MTKKKTTKKQQIQEPIVPPHRTIADIIIQYDADVQAARAALPWSLKCSAFPEFRIYGDCVAFSDNGDILTLDSARQVLKMLLMELTPTPKKDKLHKK
jgi:hypothetical protein